MAELISAFGDDLHDVLRTVARAGPLARDPETGVVIVLRHADVEALGRDPRLVGFGLGNFDVMGITDGPLRDWYSRLMFTNEGATHRRLRSLVQKAFTPRRWTRFARRPPRWPPRASTCCARQAPATSWRRP